MKKSFLFKLMGLFCFVLFSAQLSAQTVKTLERGATETLSVDGSYSSIQWQTSTDNKAWYSLPNKTAADFEFTMNAPAFIRAELKNGTTTSYSDVYQFIFNEKAVRKEVKSSGGQAYAETIDGQPASGISIQEDRGSDGKLKLTAYSNNWTNSNATLNWYLYHTIAEYDVKLILNIPKNTIQQYEFSIININDIADMQETSTIISTTGIGANDTIHVLRTNTPRSGFYKYRLTPLRQPSSSMKVVGMLFNSLNSTSLDVHATNYLSSPSVHLSSWRSTDSSVKSGQKYDWAYMEIMVPEGGDALSTYYMSLGVLAGYMGIQTNSNSERGVIFSMWDDGDTDTDPTLDQWKRAGAVDADPATTVSRFGNEGTGTKSFVHGNNWKSGVPVKFLTNARLEEYKDTFTNVKGNDSIVQRRNTLVSAWYHSDPEKGWKYISTLRLPNKVSYFDSWYSFLENYGYTNGQIKRYAYYYNAFAHEQSSNPNNPGRWISFNKVNFGNTDGAAGQRRDFEQGVAPDNPNSFYMSSGGYANAIKKYADQIPLATDKSVVESLDLSKFLERVDEAVAKEKAKNDSIKNVTSNLADKKGWSIENFSSQETSGEGAINGRAATVIDNDKNTFWHSAWQSGTAKFPHHITVNMNKTEKVTGFMFQLSGGTTRHMKGIELWGAKDNGELQLMLATNAPDLEQLYIPLDKTWEISKFKLVINNSHSGQVHCRINEIDVTVQKTTSGVEDTKLAGNQGLFVFPNPAKDYINISYNREVTSAQLTLINMEGKLVQSQTIEAMQPYQVKQIDTSKQHTGYYLLRITESTGEVNNRMIYINR